jgi:Protein of unknown function (DUF3037)
MAHIYDFAIIRVSPDPRRGELVNIGIAVFLQDTIDVRVLPSLAKVHALHQELNLTQLYDLPERFNEICPAEGSVEERHGIIRSIGMVELSALGKFTAAGNQQYEERLDHLMKNLVRPTVAPRERGITSKKLNVQVRKIIKQAGLLGRQKEDLATHKIITRFPIAEDKGLYADFAGKNSIYYFTKTVDYRVDRGIHTAKLNETGLSAITLYEAGQLFHDSKRIVMYAASARTETQLQAHLNLLGEFSTNLFNFESTQDRAKYVEFLAGAFGQGLQLTGRHA